jgi:hypothetical protein
MLDLEDMQWRYFAKDFERKAGNCCGNDSTYSTSISKSISILI